MSNPFQFLEDLGYTVETSFRREFDPISRKYLMDCPEANHIFLYREPKDEVQLATWHIYNCQRHGCVCCGKNKILINQALRAYQRNKMSKLSSADI